MNSVVSKGICRATTHHSIRGSGRLSSTRRQYPMDATFNVPHPSGWRVSSVSCLNRVLYSTFISALACPFIGNINFLIADSAFQYGSSLVKDNSIQLHRSLYVYTMDNSSNIALITSGGVIAITSILIYQLFHSNDHLARKAGLRLPAGPRRLPFLDNLLNFPQNRSVRTL